MHGINVHKNDLFIHMILKKSEDIYIYIYSERERERDRERICLMDAKMKRSSVAYSLLIKRLIRDLSEWDTPV